MGEGTREEEVMDHVKEYLAEEDADEEEGGGCTVVTTREEEGAVGGGQGAGALEEWCNKQEGRRWRYLRIGANMTGCENQVRYIHL